MKRLIALGFLTLILAPCSGQTNSSDFTVTVGSSDMTDSFKPNSGTIISAEDEARFVRIELIIENTSEEKKKYQLGKCYLIDPDTGYRIRPSHVTNTFSDKVTDQFSLNLYDDRTRLLKTAVNGKSRVTRILYYHSKSESRPTELLIHGKTHILTYDE